MVMVKTGDPNTDLQCRKRRGGREIRDSTSKLTNPGDRRPTNGRTSAGLLKKYRMDRIKNPLTISNYGVFFGLFGAGLRRQMIELSNNKFGTQFLAYGRRA